jgi:hexosaminidase
MAQKAAGIPGRVYSHAELAMIVKYATERGVRVLPEVESPGHGAGWSLAFPDMLTSCPSAVTTAYTRPMWPLGDRVAARVASVIAEVAAIFPEPTFHLGGDEVHLPCYEVGKQPGLQLHIFIELLSHVLVG